MSGDNRTQELYYVKKKRKRCSSYQPVKETYRKALNQRTELLLPSLFCPNISHQKKIITQNYNKKKKRISSPSSHDAKEKFFCSLKKVRPCLRSIQVNSNVGSKVKGINQRLIFTKKWNQRGSARSQCSLGWPAEGDCTSCWTVLRFPGSLRSGRVLVRGTSPLMSVSAVYERCLMGKNCCVWIWLLPERSLGVRSD